MGQVTIENITSGFTDLDERRRAALAEIENEKFGWFQIRACLISGIGFFTDAYDIFAINLVSVMLGYVYFPETNLLPHNVDVAVKVSTPVGTMVGQFFFGWLADKVGRKRIYGLELIIIIVCTIGTALSSGSLAVSAWGIIVFWRTILGFGIGGDYPLSAVITSEFATTKHRGAMMAAVFAMQGFGILGAAIVSLIVVVAYQSAIEHNPQFYLDQVWRIVIGLGAVPGFAALYFRLTMPETPRYTLDVENQVLKPSKDTSVPDKEASADDYEEAGVVVRSDVPKVSWIKHFGQWKYGKVLFGTAYTWFALDVAYYGLGLNNSFILKQINFGTKNDAYGNLFNIIVGNIILNLLGTVPGYWITVFTIETLGRKPIQYLGFLVLTIVFIILGFGFETIKNASPAAFIFLFTLAQLFFNFGPNATTFIVPGEVFPTRYRTTGHGISAASGKFGAIVAQVVFGELKDIGGATGSGAFIPHLLQIFAFFMLTGLLATYFIPETKGISLEDLSKEDQPEPVRTAKVDVSDII